MTIFKIPWHTKWENNRKKNLILNFFYFNLHKLFKI